jgi:hypothetical protein
MHGVQPGQNSQCNDWAAGWTTRVSSLVEAETFLCTTALDLPPGSLRNVFSGYWTLFPPPQGGRGVKPFDLYVVPKLSRLYNNSGYHSGGCEEFCLLRYNWCPFKVSRRLRGICRLYMQKCPACYLLRHVSPKRRLTFSGLHGVIFPKYRKISVCEELYHYSHICVMWRNWVHDISAFALHRGTNSDVSTARNRMQYDTS